MEKEFYKVVFNKPIFVESEQRVSGETFLVKDETSHEIKNLRREGYINKLEPHEIEAMKNGN